MRNAQPYGDLVMFEFADFINSVLPGSFSYHGLVVTFCTSFNFSFGRTDFLGRPALCNSCLYSSAE